MIVIFMQGGIGNQLFQYALYTKLQMQGRRVCLDYSSIENEMNRISRQTIFNVFQLDRKYHLSAGRGLVGKLQRRVLVPLFKRLMGCYFEKEDGLFDPKVLQLQKGYLHGYWQSPKYFEDCDELLRHRLTFQHQLNAGSQEMLEKIRSAKTPVSVHIRLGDYTTGVNSEIFGNICTKEYYTKAISFITERYPDATFFVFSNEPKKATEVIYIPNAVIVDVNDESTASADMYLMSQCQHSILANSSFSWWAAWLNRNPEKQIIAPKKWLNGKPTPDICPDSWIRF